MKLNGELIRILRIRTGYSGAQFSVECEISPQMLSDIERGKRNPSPAVAQRIATALEVPMHILLRKNPERVA